MAKGISIQITGDASKLTQATGKAEADLKKLGNAGTSAAGGLGSIGEALAGGSIVGAGAALLKMSNDSTDAALAVGKLSRITGETPEAMSGLAYAARMTNVDVGDLSKSLGIAAKNMESGKFDKLGIEAKNADGSLKPMEQTLAAVADRFAHMDGPERTAMALQLFGRAGEALVPMLANGSEALAGYTDEAKKFGLVFDQAAIQKAKEAKKAQRELQASWESMSHTIGEMVTPALVKAEKSITEVTQGLKNLWAMGDGSAAKGIGDTMRTNFENAGTYAEKLDYLKREQDAAADAARAHADADSFLGGMFNSNAGALNQLASETNKATIQSTLLLGAMQVEATQRGITVDQLIAEKKGKENAAKATDGIITKDTEYVETVRDVGKAWDDAKSAQDKYFGKQTSVLDAQIKSRDEWDKFNEVMAKNGSHFSWITGETDLNTAAGRENTKVIEDLAKTLADEDLAWAKQNSDVDEGRRRLEAHRTEMINHMVQSGWSRDAAQKFLDKIGMVPQKVTTEWRESGLDEETEAAGRLLARMQQIGVVSSQGYANSGFAWLGASPGRNASGTSNWRGGATTLSEYGRAETAILPSGTRILNRTETERMNRTGVGSGGQPMIVQLVLPDGRMLAETVIDAIDRHGL